MRTSVSEDLIAKTEAEELIASIPLMPEVESIDVEPYVDHTGDPSLQLTFWMKKDAPLDQAFMDRFQTFKSLVQTRILHSTLDRFPYARLRQAS